MEHWRPILQQQLEKYNYLPILMDDLPSRGMCYKPGTFIKGRFLTIQDIKFLSLLSDQTAEMIINEIIDRCFYMNIAVEELAICDRTYLIFWLRANSFMKENGYRVSVNKCTTCGRPFEHTIKLDDIPIKQLYAMPGTVVLPKTQREVRLKLPTVKDLSIIDDDPDVQLIARMVDEAEPIQFVMNMKVLDFTYLLNVCKSFDVGFDMKFELECPYCHSNNPLQCIISESALFGQINMRDILSISMKITKYLTYQIADDTSWPEFEMIAELTNAMIKEENTEMAKQEAAAKAKAQAAQSQARSRNYRTH